MTPLDSRAAELSRCAYCPSLCRHACPVATVEGTDTTSPWGLMSLVDHVRRGLVELDGDVARLLYACVGCGACTAACLHDADVEGTLLTARTYAVERGLSPFGRERFEHPALPTDESALGGAHATDRFERRPMFSLLPGRAALQHTPRALEELLALCERLDVDAISCGDAACLDAGYDLWFAGHHRDFVAQARRVCEAVSGARELVVMSAETLYLLEHVYPQFGLEIAAELVHTSEFILPLLSGAVVDRLDVRVAYHDSCHLARHLGRVDVPRQVLRRVLAQPLVELGYRGDTTWCCGGTGCASVTRPATARAQAAALVDRALEAGVDRLVSFSPECVAAVRAAAGDALQVDHAVSLVLEAVVADGGAG